MFVGGITEVGYKPPIKRYKRVIPTKNIIYDETGKKTYKIWDNHEVVGRFPISERSEYRVSLCARHGEKKLEIRIFYSYAHEPDRWIPTRTGIILPLHINRNGVASRPFDGFEKVVAEAMKYYDDFPIHVPGQEVFSTRKFRPKWRKRKK